MKMINTRKQFAELRNRYFSAMQRKFRQGAYELRVGAPTSAQATAAAMEADYPKLQAISALATPTESDFGEAAEIFKRHGIL